MSTEYANLGFRVDSSGLMTADQRLKNVTQSGKRAESQISMLSKTVGVAAAAFATFNASMSIKNTIFGFDTALKGLQATTRATAADMAKLETQARQLGATSKFSATEAAEAQRFLAMAGFDTNKILASTPSVLKLATAGEISLAQAADMASNALGGMQLPVEELDRVIDVMAEAASSANTNITELSEALSYAAPLAASAGVEMEELTAVIGALSDSGIKSSRAGTGVIGIIRQISNVTPQAIDAIGKYGLTLDDISIKSHGLTGVMKTLRDANLEAEDAFKLFGSETAAAGLIVSSYSDKVQLMTERYKNAKGSAEEMANIMAGSLAAGALGLGSALQEVSLQIGDAGVAGGMKEAMTAATGFIHVFTGFLPEFATANNLTADYVSNLNDVADIATIATGALVGLLGLMLTTKVATLGAAGAMGILNAVMLANPFVLAAGAIAAVTGALYAARNMTVDFGGETVKVRDIVVGAFDAISDGFNIVSDTAFATYNLLGDFFTGLSQNSQSTGADITSTIGGSFLNIYSGAKSLVNGVIATFVTLGKSIGIIAASVTMAFSNSFDNVKNLGSALKQDLDAVLSGDFSANNLKSAIDKAFTNPLKMTFSELGKAAADSFNADYIGDSAQELSGIFSEIKGGLDLYVIAARNARVENEKLGDSNKDLADDIDWVLSELDKLNSGSGKTQGTGGGLVSGMSDDLDSLIDQVDNFGGAWTRTGNVIVDAMGSATDAMIDYMSQMEGLSKLENDLLDEQEKYRDDKEKSAEIDKALQKVSSQRAIAEINGYQAASKAAQDMFSEKTAAHKVFSAINQTLAVAEMALMYQNIAASNTETAARVANEGTKQGANALTAITSAFAAPWPINFVAGAAMIGIMASLLGGAFGGGGGGGGSTTGTTLGGDPSKSISNINNDLEDIMIAQLAELRGLRSDLTDVDNQAFSLLKTLLYDTRDHSEITNPYERKLEDSFDNLNSGFYSNSNGDYTSQLRSIFDTVEGVINDSISLLGASTTKSLSTFVFDVGTISFDHLDASEAQERLDEILSSQSDMMAEHLIPSITKFQQVGEGAFETLVRVAKEQVTFNDSLNEMGVSLGNLSGMLAVDVSQNIIDLVGGIDNFTDYVGEFADEFLSDSQKIANLEGSLTDVFDQLGLSLTNSREGFADLVSGIDITTDQGQDMLAALLEVTPAMAEYVEMLEDLESERLSLQIQLLEEMGKSEEALAMQRQIELDALDESLHSLQLQVWAQQDLNKAREEERQLLTDNVAFAEQQLEKARQAEIARINSTVEAAEEAYNSTLESINLQREAYNKMISELQSAVDKAASNLQESLNAELSKYDDLIRASRERASEEISLINSISSARVSALSSELSLISGIANQYGASSVGVSASEALRAARAGNFEPATRVQTGGNFANATEAKISKAREDFALAEIGKLADAQMSDLERTISATESSAQSQIDAINAASEREVAELESQRAAVEEQIKEILGITDTVLSLDEATAQYQKAQDDLQNALAENTLDKLQAQENIALQSLEQAREDAQKQIDALNEQVDSLLNIDNSVSSVDEAIKLLLAERKELAEFEKSIQESQLASQQETTSAVLLVESAIKESMITIKDSIGNYRVIDNRPPDQNAPIIVYAPSSAGEDKMSQEIKSMKEAMESQNRSIAKSSATTAKILQRIELGGLEVR